MLRDTGEDVDPDSEDSDYWKEAPGNIPLDMQKNFGFAQLLLPGPELIDIGLPKDEVQKQKVLEMYASVLKDQLEGLNDFDDGFDVEDDGQDLDLDDESIEKLISSGVDMDSIMRSLR